MNSALRARFHQALKTKKKSKIAARLQKQTKLLGKRHIS